MRIVVHFSSKHRKAVAMAFPSLGSMGGPPTSRSSDAVRSTSSTGNTIVGRSTGRSGAVRRLADSSSVVALSSVWYVFAEAKDVMEGACD